MYAEDFIEVGNAGIY